MLWCCSFASGRYSCHNRYLFTWYWGVQEIVREWHELGVLKQILAHKLVFIETTDVLETTLALENFKR